MEQISRKGQTALEYMLIIVISIIVVMMVVLFLQQMAVDIDKSANGSTSNTFCGLKNCTVASDCFDACGEDVECNTVTHRCRRLKPE